MTLFGALTKTRPYRKTFVKLYNRFVFKHRLILEIGNIIYAINLSKMHASRMNLFHNVFLIVLSGIFDIIVLILLSEFDIRDK